MIWEYLQSEIRRLDSNSCYEIFFERCCKVKCADKFLAATSRSRSDDVINERPLTAVWFEMLMTFHTTQRPHQARDSTPDPERYQGN